MLDAEWNAVRHPGAAGRLRAGWNPDVVRLHGVKPCPVPRSQCVPYAVPWPPMPDLLEGPCSLRSTGSSAATSQAAERLLWVGTRCRRTSAVWQPNSTGRFLATSSGDCLAGPGQKPPLRRCSWLAKCGRSSGGTRVRVFLGSAVATLNLCGRQHQNHRRAMAVSLAEGPWMATLGRVRDREPTPAPRRSSEAPSLRRSSRTAC